VFDAYSSGGFRVYIRTTSSRCNYESTSGETIAFNAAGGADEFGLDQVHVWGLTRDDNADTGLVRFLVGDTIYSSSGLANPETAPKAATIGIGYAPNTSGRQYNGRMIAAGMVAGALSDEDFLSFAELLTT
jgi:hypothetical protein